MAHQLRGVDWHAVREGPTAVRKLNQQSVVGRPKPLRGSRQAMRVELRLSAARKGDYGEEGAPMNAPTQFGSP